MTTLKWFIGAALVTASAGAIWHAASYGWALAESADLTIVYKYTRQWQDIVRFDATPVMGDAGTAVVLK